MKLTQMYYLSFQRREFELMDDEVMVTFSSPTNSWQDRYKYKDLEREPAHVHSSNSEIKTFSFIVFMIGCLAVGVRFPLVYSCSILLLAGLICIVYIFYKHNFLVFLLKANKQQGFAIRLSKKSSEKIFLDVLSEKLR